MEITVSIHGLDTLATAITAMAQAIRQGAPAAPAAPVVPAMPPNPAEPVAPMASAQPASAPAPAAQATPIVPATPAAPPAPAPAVPLATAPQQYTLAELQKAVMPLFDAGKMTELQQVLAKYGAQDLTKVPTEQYGALAADFRALGARL